VALVVGGGLALWVTGRIERNLLKGIEAKGESR
jgi:hypothetical protein